MNKRKKFPLITTSFALIALVAGVWGINNISQRFDTRKKANEDRSKIKPSQWVPIKLTDLNRDLNNQTKFINQEIIKLNQATNLNKIDKETQKERLNRSLKIQENIRQSFTSMDTKKDGQIDYTEFNANSVNLSTKIYNLRHSKNKTKADGLYYDDGSKVTKVATDLSQKKILHLVVEEGIYLDLRSYLKTYASDIEKDNANYKVKIFRCNGCSKEEIKTLLKTRGTVGAVFVGDLPIAWYATYNCFGWTNSVENFPIDLYYMDLNGIWGGIVDCGTEKCFTSHSGNMQPEIFVARLAPPVESQEVELLKKYFVKNHNYRTSGNGAVAKSLNYVDDTWDYLAEYWNKEIYPAYPDFDSVYDKNTTSSNDYKKRLEKLYEHVLVAVHSSYYTHYFESLTDPGFFNWNDVKDLKAKSNFYNLFACSNALYTVENYMAGWYTFQDSNYGLISVGSAKTGSMLGFEQFYKPLGQRKNFGEAYKEWFLNYDPGYSDKCWHGGMVMVGDPTLKSTYVDPLTITPKPTTTPTIKISPTPTLKPTGTSTLKPTATPTLKPTGVYNLVNGSCGTLIDTCISGKPGPFTITTNGYEWDCIGFNGGSDAHCVKPE